MYRSGCPVTNVLDLVGDRWSLVIIRDIFMGRKTFKEFLNAPENIASNILTSRLRSLTREGFINFTYSPNNKKTKYYYLENKGIDFYPILYEMSMWSERNLEKPFHPLSTKWFIDNKGKLAKEVIEKEKNNYLEIRDQLFEETGIKL
ncbi:MAG: winged helix-turn-helix transcriptional regulator [Flavobacteriaceae bacterium]